MRHLQAVFAVHLAIDGVGVVERGVSLGGVAIQAEVRVVVQEVAQDVMAVVAVAHGVEDVLMPEEVDGAVRDVLRGIGVLDDTRDVTLVPLLRFDCLRFVPTLPFGVGFHELAPHHREVERVEAGQPFIGRNAAGGENRRKNQLL